MCEFCDNLNTASTQNPIQITCYWEDNFKSASLTSDLSRCTIAFLDTRGRPIKSFPFNLCPVCGKSLKIEECATYEDIVKREG